MTYPPTERPTFDFMLRERNTEIGPLLELVPKTARARGWIVNAKPESGGGPLAFTPDDCVLVFCELVQSGFLIEWSVA
jgi:hypothetical protein